MNFDGVQVCGVKDAVGRGDRCQWPTTVVTWHASFRLGGLSQDEVTDAFKLACSWWDEVSGIQHEFTSNPKTANILAQAGSIDGSGKTLAWSELPCGNVHQVQQLYDDTEAWSIAANPPPGRIDFARTAAHEVGHGDGLPHIANGNLMQDRYSNQIRKPQRGDIIEFQARYGQASPGNGNGGDICETCEVLFRSLGVDEQTSRRAGKHARLFLKDLEVGLRRLKQGSSEPE